MRHFKLLGGFAVECRQQEQLPVVGFQSTRFSLSTLLKMLFRNRGQASSGQALQQYLPIYSFLSTAPLPLQVICLQNHTNLSVQAFVGAKTWGLFRAGGSAVEPDPQQQAQGAHSSPGLLLPAGPPVCSSASGAHAHGPGPAPQPLHPSKPCPWQCECGSPLFMHPGTPSHVHSSLTHSLTHSLVRLVCHPFTNVFTYLLTFHVLGT